MSPTIAHRQGEDGELRDWRECACTPQDGHGSGGGVVLDLVYMSKKGGTAEYSVVADFEKRATSRAT